MLQFTISPARHLDNVDEAPPLAGIYVWYGRLAVGPADWDIAVTASEEVAQQQLLRALRDHSVKHRQQSLYLAALANFTNKWTGELPAELPDKWTNDEQGVWTPDSKHDLAEVTALNRTREELLNLLSDAFPLFFSPLYIGIAIDQTLRKRLKTHRSQFRRHWENLSNDPSYSARIVQPTNFADRAIKVGFSPADLYFFTLHIEDDGRENFPEERDRLLRSAEWLLNRWANPILGRK